MPTLKVIVLLLHGPEPGSVVAAESYQILCANFFFFEVHFLLYYNGTSTLSVLDYI